MARRWSVFVLIVLLLAQGGLGAASAGASMSGAQAVQHAAEMPCAQHAHLAADHAGSQAGARHGHPLSPHDCCRGHAFCHCGLVGIASTPQLPRLMPAAFVSFDAPGASLTRLRSDELLRPPIR